MKFSFKMLGLLILYVVTLGLFGNWIANSLLGLIMMIVGSLSPGGLVLTAFLLLGLTPLIVAIPFCIEIKEDEEDVEKTKTEG